MDNAVSTDSDCEVPPGSPHQHDAGHVDHDLGVEGLGVVDLAELRYLALDLRKLLVHLRSWGWGTGAVRVLWLRGRWGWGAGLKWGY